MSQKDIEPSRVTGRSGGTETPDPIVGIPRPLAFCIKSCSLTPEISFMFPFACFEADRLIQWSLLSLLLSFLLFMFEMTLSMSTVTVLAIAFLGPDQAPGIRRTECKGLHMAFNREL